jgi:hypothetical protein
MWCCKLDVGVHHADCGFHVANVSRGAADKFRKCAEMPGNKREQTATWRDMKIAAISRKPLN